MSLSSASRAADPLTPHPQQGWNPGLNLCPSSGSTVAGSPRAAGPGGPLCTPRPAGPQRSAPPYRPAGTAVVLPALVLSLSSSFGSSGDSVIGQLFSCEMENCSMCRCGKETVRVSSTLLFTLSYPESTGNSLGALVAQGRAGPGTSPRPCGVCHPYGGAVASPGDGHLQRAASAGQRQSWRPRARGGFPTSRAFGDRKADLGADLLAGGCEENPRGLAELNW